MAFDNEELNKRRQERAKRKEQAQQKRKKETILLAVIAGILVVAIVAVLIVILTGNRREPDPEPSQTGTSGIQTVPPTTVPPTTVPPTTVPPDTVIHLVAGGDLNITDKVVAAGKTETGYDYSKVILDVLPILAEADVSMLNLEGILRGSPYGAASAPPELLTALKKAGVDLLQTANSHSVDGGMLGLISTIQAIRAAGMEPVGTFESTQAFRKDGGFTMLEVKGIRIAVVAFTKGMDGRGLPEGSEDCVNLLYTDYNSTYQKVDTEEITRVVRNAAAHEPDIMVALLHWGSELNDQISSSQTKIRNLLLSEGVDAIIGTHSHYVQKMEFDRENGTFVAYSLGDFYGDGTTAGTNYSVLLDLEITKDGTTGQAKITGFDYVPIFLQTQEDNKVRVLRLRDAIVAYENQYLGRVSEADYLAMKNALERIEARVGIKP